MKLSENFTLQALTLSQKAQELGLDNQPPMEHIPNLRRLALGLEQVLDLLGHGLTITSAYRSPALNAAVGGVKNSAHARGLAADFVCPAFGSPLVVARALAASALPFDQIIHEYGRWVHLAFADRFTLPRRQLLTICSAEQGYEDGLLACVSRQ